ncbi:MAG TPA: hypothetical protein VMT99_03380 [Candidatus Paceibacterota bacterium]|nr:hypothetical protein [Candidatus Paceibacterota bacterium]
MLSGVLAWVVVALVAVVAAVIMLYGTGAAFMMVFARFHLPIDNLPAPLLAAAVIVPLSCALIVLIAVLKMGPKVKMFVVGMQN